MKKIIVLFGAALLTALSLSSCDKPDECPEINKGYVTKIIIEDPKRLSAADIEYIKALQAEYNANAK